MRFIELIDVGSAANWDAHGDMDTHIPLAKNVDRAIAGLLKDLKSRGMLEETLVVWTTEFGRTPYNEQPNARGREHHHLGLLVNLLLREEDAGRQRSSVGHEPS